MYQTRRIPMEPHNCYFDNPKIHFDFYHDIARLLHQLHTRSHTPFQLRFSFQYFKPLFKFSVVSQLYSASKILLSLTYFFKLGRVIIWVFVHYLGELSDQCLLHPFFFFKSFFFNMNKFVKGAKESFYIFLWLSINLINSSQVKNRANWTQLWISFRLEKVCYFSCGWCEKFADSITLHDVY